MPKKKQMKDKYDGLHGQELIDAIMKDGTFGKPVTESQARENDKLIAKMNRRYEKEQEIKSKICLALKPIFFTPLSIMFCVLTFVFRVIGGVTSVALPFGIYFTYKCLMQWRTNGVATERLRASIASILFPFIASAFAILTEKLWNYFEENK